MKDLLHILFKKLGFRLIREREYQQLLESNDKNGFYNKAKLLSDFFKLLQSNNFNPKAIYDVGANKGFWTKASVDYFPDAEYHLFEPQKKLNDFIDQNLRRKVNYSIHNIGVGDKNSKELFTIHNRDDSSSFIIDSNEARKANLNQIKLDIRRLEDFAEIKGIPKPQLLKIDAEGLDIEVIEGAGNLLKYVEVILIEVSILNQRMKNDSLSVLNLLNDKGFALVDITDLNRPFTGKALWLSEFAFVKRKSALFQNLLSNK